jgi:hypothetical protein
MPKSPSTKLGNSNHVEVENFVFNLLLSTLKVGGLCHVKAPNMELENSNHG